MSLCKLTEMWGKRSALVSEDCAFAQMKRTLQQRLQEEKIFIQDDAQNRTPHVNAGSGHADQNLSVSQRERERAERRSRYGYLLPLRESLLLHCVACCHQARAA